MAVQFDTDFQSMVPSISMPSIGVGNTSGSQATSFGDQVKNAIDHINTLQSQANDMVEEVASGNPENAHQAVIAMQHSLMALDFSMQMRNKVLDAYQEIMRMQL